MKRRTVTNIIIIALTAIMTSLILYKIFVVKQDFNDLIPSESYRVDINIYYTGYGEDITIKTFIPGNEHGQIITPVFNSGLRSEYKESSDGATTSAFWTNYSFKGKNSLIYSFNAQLKELTYTLDPDMLIPDENGGNLTPYLRSTEDIQVYSPEVKELARSLKDPDNLLKGTLDNIYNHITEFENRAFKGTTDAVTALKLQAASCNGKSRLFVALTRNLGIPSRLVGGLILKNGSKKTTHQWVEVWVNGHWIPYDTLNDHYMKKPNNYLSLYRGDEVMFKYSRDIGFNYRYDIKKGLSSNARLEQFLGSNNLNLYSFLTSFKKVNISLNLLKLILMIPIGVLIVVISRNIIGINTFGTFLPALMAVAIRETGYFPGVIAFVFTIMIVSAIRYPMQRLGILHTPKLAVMMIGVVISIFSLTIIADLTGWSFLSTIGSATLFPIAIMTITSERVAISIEEEGAKKTILMIFNTLLVMSFCYLVMNSLALQTLLLAFPEIILGVAAFNIAMGSWIGIRVTELIRFKSILAREWKPSAEL